MHKPFGPGSATTDRRRRHTKTVLVHGLLAWVLMVRATGALATAVVPDDLDPATRAAIRQAVVRSPGFDNRFAAEVWLVDMSHRLAPRIPDVNRRLALLRDVHAAATAAGLSPQLVLALIEVESGFKRFALSSAGAQGLMQVMPFWRHELGEPADNLFARRINLRYGCAILAVYLRREQGNTVRALARYNGSLGRTDYPDRVLGALRRHWQVP